MGAGRLSRTAIVYALEALEALEAGDQATAVDVLLGALDDRPDVGAIRRLPPLCPVCGQRAAPGDLARHVYSLHNPPAETMRQPRSPRAA